MATALDSFANNCRSSKFFHFLGRASVGHKNNCFDACFCELGNDGRGVSGRNRANLHAFFNADIGDLVDTIVLHDQIDRKRLIGQRTCGSNLFTHIFRCVESALNNTQSTGIGNSGSKFSVGDMGHGALDNGVFDVKQVAKFGLH